MVAPSRGRGFESRHSRSREPRVRGAVPFRGSLDTAARRRRGSRSPADGDLVSRRLAPSQESQALCPLGVMRMSNDRAGSRKSTDSKRSKKGRVTRTIFPREATAQEIADQINAMLKKTKG